MGISVNPNILNMDIDKEVEKYNATKKVKPIVGDFVFKPSNRSLGGDIKKAMADAQKMMNNPLSFSSGNVSPIYISSNFDDKAKTQADKVAEAVKGVRDAVSSYMDKLKSATDSTQQFVGLFDRFQNKAISLSKLIRNMSINRDTMISWQDNIAKLQQNGLNASFIQELIKKGVSGANEVKALAKSTPEQIAQLNALWADQRWNAGTIGDGTKLSCL